ncbi:MAG: FMN-binding protein [bacterium]|nr:FMN-binding protein [bacterium]
MHDVVAAPRTWPMYRAMVGVGLLCGVFIVSVFQITRPAIERNKAEALQRAIFQVLPDATSSATFVMTDDSFEPATEGATGRRVHAGYDEADRLVGLAVEAAGMGYQDFIRVLYGYSIERRAIVGLRVLESKETPGLGDKIETDAAFTANFERLDVALTADGSAIANPIVTVKQGKKQQPWQVDGITGATISSVAIGDLLRESTEFWIPRIRRDANAFRRGEGETQ